ncbi:MAG: carboxymuconolactone decarboxylase family protein [Proteobacteria bacterium]|nr:carboxymuconolactone decarboxylase family protein [Pseudomonadota bacterium]MBU1452642.1 carboxymuconolactone decarboxylase family protein [Pseudomonadota bacterium]MBU2467662.1 carboxymuconolactone decarboxylase family protein [Pseudomonadota bacterium]MBU2518550.1 carboxymuconolactone decarboxylase family protein [Pseudomonadota bacterium]
MIPPKQNEAFEKFLETVKDNGVLEADTTTLVFLGAALAIRCRHCAERFIGYAKTIGVSDEQMGAVAAIAMCVRAGSARALAFEIAEAQD